MWHERGDGHKILNGKPHGKGCLRDQDVVGRIEGPVISFCVVCDEP